MLITRAQAEQGTGVLQEVDPSWLSAFKCNENTNTKKYKFKYNANTNTIPKNLQCRQLWFGIIGKGYIFMILGPHHKLIFVNSNLNQAPRWLHSIKVQVESPALLCTWHHTQTKVVFNSLKLKTSKLTLLPLVAKPTQHFPTDICFPKRWCQPVQLYSCSPCPWCSPEAGPPGSNQPLGKERV